MPRSFARPDHVRLIRWSAALVLLAGYADLVLGGVTFAPFLLIAGYLVLVPLALLVR